MAEKQAETWRQAEAVVKPTGEAMVLLQGMMGRQSMDGLSEALG
jgi:hypothetical protein